MHAFEIREALEDFKADIAPMQTPVQEQLEALKGMAVRLTQTFTGEEELTHALRTLERTLTHAGVIPPEKDPKP